MSHTHPGVAVIADVVQSRGHPDRSALQRTVEDALARTEETVSASQPFTATVGDEFQAVFSDPFAAMTAILCVQLQLPTAVSLRFGLGLGSTVEVSSGGSQNIQDGPGWWNAREAIERVEVLARRQPQARSWFIGAGQETDALINSYLMLRDHTVADMSVSARAYACGAAQGQSQAEIAEASGVTQSAVSQSLRRSGAAALIEGLRGFARE